MARVAIVTGGTRGIGEAISLALRDAGVTVAATYGGDDAKAKAFTDRTGIAAYKWNVADHQACLDGVAHVEAAHGPVDIVVNNAGITRDGTLMKLPGEGITRIAVVSPGFSADNLETLDEIDREGREIFVEAGGTDFAYLPCLNADDDGVAMLRALLARELAGWVTPA